MDRAAAEALYTQAHQLREAGDFAGAQAAYERVAEAAPTSAGPHHWIGFVRLRQGDAPGAEQAFRRALEREPGRPVSTHGLGLALLGQGRLAEGFPLLEARNRIPERAARAPLPFRRWAGEDVSGRHILIWPEEGFGDQIQYARYTQTLAARGVRATWCCAPELAGLFAANLPVEVLRAEGSVPLPNVDFWLGSTSLPALFPSDDPLAAPYIAAPPRPTGARIGVLVRGNSKHYNDAARSLPDGAAEALLGLPGAIGLVPEDTGARDFLETAEIIAGLELVIAVDTAGAHLAAAMGKPCWLLLPHAPDWRWLPDRERSLWYPSMRIYRQPSPDAWDAVLQAVLADVRALGLAP
ncbi:tetratricopeptide repeat protein [Phenylobacterium sp.]|jgi:tetratricopeptide (TPR) repeat protein|uniref:tetratricopeptide repeat protein n=1 Tax=Phenylobacterium sp. TaxID=1871053 RepID=UPI002F9364C3